MDKELIGELTVSIIGLGYIGLPTALLFADSGVRVQGFDIDSKKIESLKNNKIFFKETGLDELYQSVQTKGTFIPVSELQPADVFIICVPTPTEKGKADLTFVMRTLTAIQNIVKDGDMVVVESTVGPTDCVDYILPEIDKWDVNCNFALCTERAIPGNTLHEMIHNDRVIGGNDDESNARASKLYKNFVQGKIFTTDPTTAAVCKVMENTYRAVNIALANQLSKLAKVYEIDIWKAIELSNQHPRVNIHSPGPGVGGHCIPIDPYFLLDGTENSSLIKESLEINESMPKYVCDEIVSLIHKHELKNSKIGILGYSYKKNVDDTRETPAAVLFAELKKQFDVVVHDPFVEENFTQPLETVLGSCDVIVVATDHDEFKSIEFKDYKNIKFIYDTRNIIDADSNNLTDIPVYTLGRY